ncbi:MAG: sulfite exporter TauE/SafE family protein [Pseudomonadota bacterium]
MLSILLAACIFTAYFIESVFGFGGTVIAIAAISYFIDIKTAILIGAYAAICASSFILMTGYKSFSLSHLIRIYTYALPGVFIGTVIFLYTSPVFLLKFFALFLIFYSLYSFWKPDFRMSPLVSRIVLFFSGLIQGIYGTGGPFMLMAYGHEFKTKSELRSMVAAFLLFGNVVRVIQMYFMGQLDTAVFIENWWIIVPVAIAVFSGFTLHKRLSDSVFKKGVFALMLIAGVSFLFK